MGIEILGTGHILEKSVREVKEKIEEKRPEILALELDENRFQGLMRKRLDCGKDKLGWRDLLKSGKGGSFLVLSFLLEKIQRKLGKKLGVFPGSEMIAAVNTLEEVGGKIVLIDRDIKITLNHFLRIPFKEKINLLKVGKKGENKLNSLNNLEDLLEEEVVEKLMGEMREELPYTYKVFVDERDKFMAYSLSQIQRRYKEKDILGIVGKGHKKGILKYLKLFEGKDEKIINLEEILEERKVSVFQFISVFFIIVISIIVMEISLR